jgi:hypothetical protein
VKRILWCGGSHLADAKTQILNVHRNRFSDHEPVFYITASPKNRDWSAAGGRYVVKDSTVGGNAAEPDRIIDMSSLSQIVFIGQFIQPHRFLTGAAPLSNSLLQTIFEKYPLYFPVNPHDPHLAYNEPLELFRNLTDCRIFLVPDPLPTHAGYKIVPLAQKKFFYAHVDSFCRRNSIDFCGYPPSALLSDMTTDPTFQRSAEDPVHMSERYWQLVFAETLLPLMGS